MSVSRAEREALFFIANLDDESNRPCAGPLVIHRDGVFGCIGGSCDGVAHRFHGEDSVTPCDVVELPAGGPSCGRCRNRSGRRR